MKLFRVKAEDAINKQDEYVEAEDAADAVRILVSHFAWKASDVYMIKAVSDGVLRRLPDGASK